MDMLYEVQRIKCGNHTLDPEITIEAAKCGRTAQATHYKIDQPVRERTFY